MYNYKFEQCDGSDTVSIIFQHERQFTHGEFRAMVLKGYFNLIMNDIECKYCEAQTIFYWGLPMCHIGFDNLIVHEMEKRGFRRMEYDVSMRVDTSIGPFSDAPVHRKELFSCDLEEMLLKHVDINRPGTQLVLTRKEQ